MIQYNRVVRQTESANTILQFDFNFGALKFNNIDILTKYEPLRWSWDSMQYFLKWKLGSSLIHAIDLSWIQCTIATLNDLFDFCVEKIDTDCGLKSLCLVELPAGTELETWVIDRLVPRAATSLEHLTIIGMQNTSP